MAISDFYSLNDEYKTRLVLHTRDSKGNPLRALSDDVAVMNSATVNDLKLAVKKKVNDMEQSKMGHRHISCVHVSQEVLNAATM
ncbi:putative U11/U12 small nuclear ribonucleoprotein 25kDa protein [Helianthus debilis subsp. tardiflorus]